MVGGFEQERYRGCSRLFPARCGGTLCVPSVLSVNLDAISGEADGRSQIYAARSP